MNAKKLAALGLLTAVALSIHFAESLLPPLIPLPGVKPGLANIVTVFTVFLLGSREGAAVLTCRILLGAVFGGNFSAVLYSGAGGLCAILTTVALKRLLTRKQLWVAGALSAVAHSVGQLAAAIAITATPELLLYLPVMAAVSIVTGSFTGFCAQLLLDRGDTLWKTIFK